MKFMDTKINLKNVYEGIEEQIKKYKPELKVERVGMIESLSDGVAEITGLNEVAAGEILEFPNRIYGLALNLTRDKIGAIILGDYLKLKEGDLVKGTGRLLSIPVGDQFLSRVINPLGEPLDGKGVIKSQTYYPLERLAPGVIARQPVDTPFQTGIKAIDSMIPIGRGQRELIIGDRGTGKTALTLDMIINQGREKSSLICIYVAIGQKTSRVASVVETLKNYNAIDYTIIVSADASSPASLQYLAPYAGCAIGEYFMDKGKDAVVIYDDLTKHAWAYREISLVLRRPSGREAYPGDVFYLHSRLLERACRLSKENGGGSLTAIPIIETQAGDLSAYIPTNVISITDGQIYLETDLFYSGIRPAINAGASVSRVGSSAQIKAMKQVAGKLRLDLAQYRELSAFMQFASELDPKTRAQIDQGSRMVEILKQPQFEPVPVEKQVVIIWAGASGLLKDIPIEKMKKFETDFLSYLTDQKNEILTTIRKEKALSDKLKEKMEKILKEFLEAGWEAS